jgi:glycosyltransferase involved in cell wall biosynthesis
MKTILFITELFPYPLHSGGAIRTNSIIQELSKHYHIHVVCQSFDKNQIPLIQEVQGKNITIRCFYNPNILKTYPLSLPAIGAGIFKGLPLKVWWYRNEIMRVYIRDFIKNNHPASIHVDHILSVQFLPEVKIVPWIFYEHNIEPELFYSLSGLEKDLFWRFLYGYEVHAFSLYECRQLPLFNAVLTISERDTQQIKKRYKLSMPIITLPVLAPPRSRQKQIKTHNILFIGLMEWQPNVDAMLWFIHDIFPRIQRSVPDVTLTMVGKLGYNASVFQRYEDDHIHCVGEVNDVRPYIKRAQVFVMPFRSGAGVRLKALTAMAAGLPIVTTTQGAQGFFIKQPPPFYIADFADAFAQKVTHLMIDTAAWKRVQTSAFSYLREFHSRRVFSSTFKSILAWL